jgi:hypothetical protein
MQSLPLSPVRHGFKLVSPGVVFCCCSYSMINDSAAGLCGVHRVVTRVAGCVSSKRSVTEVTVCQELCFTIAKLLQCFAVQPPPKQSNSACNAHAALPAPFTSAQCSWSPSTTGLIWQTVAMLPCLQKPNLAIHIVLAEAVYNRVVVC